MLKGRPVGVITRGTTNPNRLRRCDRWLASTQGRRLRAHDGSPVVVDLGYGASPVTALELHERLRAVRPDVRVVGIEIDPARVEAGRAVARPGVTFALGGFEVPLPDGERPLVVRAFNVLRQYAEDEVEGAWRTVLDRLAPDGLLVEGTCDEIGRLATWVALTVEGPQSLTLSWRLGGLERPGVIAERLPKALIHRNVPGEPIHAFLTELDRAWAHSAAQSSWGARQRFRATMEAMYAAGWPLLDGPSRWRLGEVSVAWSAVAPGGPAREHDGSDHQGP